MSEGPQGGYQKHGHPAETIGFAAVAALGLEALLPSTGAPAWVLPAAEIISSCGTGFVTWSFTGRKVFPFYIAALGSFLGGWSAFADAVGLWHWTTFGSFLAGLAVLGPLGVGAWHRRKPKPKPEPPMIMPAPEPVLAEVVPDENEIQRDLFATMFADYGLYAGERVLPDGSKEIISLDVYSLEEDKAGRVVRIRLPKHGKITIEDMRSKVRNFEVAMNAQDGAITFWQGRDSADVIMKVRERDGLADSVKLLPELRARSVNDEFVVGVQEDGSYLKVTVRESHFMIIGIMGSGKSNLLNVLIAQLASCNDSVIWMVDMKGGRAGKPWFQAWSDGEADAPPIDWLATTRAEAELMMTALETAAETRSKSGIGMNKILPTAGRPQIIFICDEMADLFGDATAPTRSELGDDPKSNTWFVKRGTSITQKGRSEAVATIWASQRGTNGMSGSGDMKANIDLSIALRPKKYSDLQFIIPDAPALAARQLQLLANTRGVGMVGRGPQVSQVTKFLHHDHLEGVCGADENNPRCAPACPVYQSAVAAGPVRPRLDALTAQALGPDYSQRWVRAARDGVLRVPQKALAGGSAAFGYSRAPGPADNFDEIIKGVADPERDMHPQRLRVRNFLVSQGQMGSSVARIQAMLDEEFGSEAVTRETVHRWLKEDRDNKLVHHPGYRRWVTGDGPNISDEND